ncbi:MAG: TIM barrel protein [Anaerolineae bacterium]|nr:TIM barrel protein [Anaerolineae bacterium]
MRLGGPVFDEYTNPSEWIAALRALGYSAAYCPVSLDADDATVRAYADAAASEDIVIAEVGAWSNPISPDENISRAAVEKNIAALALAERIGARCCVNVAGSRSEDWAGPHPDNLTQATFELIVAAVQRIIAAVQPSHTFYTLEPMPWIYPDSPDSYLRLIEAIDCPQFAVHLDPVNMIASPQRYYHNDAFIHECFERLGPYLKSCHAKDIKLENRLTVHLNEVRPGLGELDYRALLTELSKLDDDTPVMLEHLETAQEYAEAAAYLRTTAQALGLAFR